MTLVFSLMGGLLVAIALQLVFANLGIALGLTVLDWSPSAAEEGSQRTGADPTDGNSTPDSKQSLPITHFLGFGVAIGFSAAVFLATLLSVEFSQIFEPRRGIIFGLIEWATYWLLFIWLSSTTISGIADSILGSALQGGKQLLTTVKKTAQQTARSLEGNDDSAAGDTPAHEYANEYIVLQDLRSEISQLAAAQKELPTLLAHQREVLLAELTDSETEAEKSAQESSTTDSNNGADIKVETVVDSSSSRPSVSTAVSTPSSSLLSQLDLPSWQQILRRTLTQVDLSNWDVETILEQLPVENKAINYAKSQLIASATTVLPESQASEDAAKKADDKQEKAVDSKADSTAMKAIQAKLIAYCRYTNIDLITPESLSEKVHSQQAEYSLETTANSGTEQLTGQLDIEAIEAILSRRNKLSTQKKQRLIKALQQAWPTAFIKGSTPTTSDREEGISPLPNHFAAEATAESSMESPMEDTVSSSDDPDLSMSSITAKAYETLENHFQSVDWSEVSLEDIKPEVTLLLEQIEKRGEIANIDWQALTSRVRLPENSKNEFVDWLQAAWSNTWTEKVQSLRPATAQRTQDLSQRTQDLSQQLVEQITHLLHHQQKTALTPTEMTQSLTQVVGGAIATLPHPASLSHLPDTSSLWNKETWQQALEKRKDLTQAEIEQVLDWGETIWQPKAEQLSSWLQTIRAEAQEHIGLPDAEQLLAKPVANAANQVVDQLVETKGSIVEQADEIKETIAGRVDEVKGDIQRQADAAKGQVAIAAWWLFIALVASGTAAAEAGYLAANY